MRFSACRLDLADKIVVFGSAAASVAFLTVVMVADTMSTRLKRRVEGRDMLRCTAKTIDLELRMNVFSAPQGEKSGGRRE